MDRHTCSIVAVGYIRQIFSQRILTRSYGTLYKEVATVRPASPTQIYQSKRETKVTESRAFCKCPDWYTSDYD